MRHPDEASRLLVHEGLHGALFHAIEESPAARDIVDHLRQTAAAIHFERGGEDADMHYGLRNAHEFVSEANSNPEFQRFLASIPADERTIKAYGLDAASKPTLWHVFTQAVRKIFSMAPGTQSYLDAAMKVTGRLLDRQEAARPAGASASPIAHAPRQSGAGPARAPRQDAQATPSLTHRAAALMPDIREKAAGAIKDAAPPDAAGDFGKRVSDNPAMVPALLSAALAPRVAGMDPTLHTAFRTLEAKGLYSPQEKALMDRETGRLRLVVKRGFPSTSEADIAAMPPYALRAAAFAHFANGRTEEGMEGGHLHVGARRAFERVYKMMGGLQTIGNRMGLYRPNDVYADASEQTVAGLSPNNPGEAMRAQQ